MSVGQPLSKISKSSIIMNFRHFERVVREWQSLAFDFGRSECRSASRMRELFGIWIVTCGLSNNQQLWEKHRNDLADDILHRLEEIHTTI